MKRQVGEPAHAIEPALAVGVPGILAAGTALDFLAGGREGSLSWLAFWMIATGVAFGVWRTAWAVVDWISPIEPGGASAHGPHTFSTATVVALYGVAVFLRLDGPAHGPGPAAVAIEVIAAALLGIETWLGSERGAGFAP